jgi:type I restriction enzyme R subunit
VTDEYHGFGLFVRSITGLRRETAVRAFDKFQQVRTFSPAQYSFVELIIESLTKNGFLDISHLYEQPFKSQAPHGPDTLFTDPDVGRIIEILDYLKQTAIPNDTAEAS